MSPAGAPGASAEPRRVIGPESKTVRIDRRFHAALRLLQISKGDMYVADTLQNVLNTNADFRRMYEKVPTPKPKKRG